MANERRGRNNFNYGGSMRAHKRWRYGRYVSYLLDAEAVALYTGIHKHEGFTAEGAHRAFAHLRAVDKTGGNPTNR